MLFTHKLNGIPANTLAHHTRIKSHSYRYSLRKTITHIRPHTFSLTHAHSCTHEHSYHSHEHSCHKHEHSCHTHEHSCESSRTDALTAFAWSRAVFSFAMPLAPIWCESESVWRGKGKEKVQRQKRARLRARGGNDNRGVGGLVGDDIRGVGWGGEQIQYHYQSV